MIPKVDDCIHLTALLSMVSYFVLCKIQFSIIDLLILNIGSIFLVQDRNFYRKPNLTLDNVNSFILEDKYNITFNSPLNHIHNHMMNKKFYLFYSSKRYHSQSIFSVEEDEPTTYWENSSRSQPHSIEDVALFSSKVEMLRE